MITFRQLRPGRCKYPIAPYGRTHVFCGKPTPVDKVVLGLPQHKNYCPEHHAVCHAGFGKPWEGIAGMIDAIEGPVRRRVPAEVEHGVDKVLEGK